MSVDRYQGFVFSPADLAEDVDLDLDRRKEILFADAHAASWTHWQALGLPWNASPLLAKAAYVEKVKIFHPDRYAGKRLGSYRARLERVFRRVTEARDLLCDEGRRPAYVKQTAPPEEFARSEARKIEDERRSEERRARLGRNNPFLARAGRVSDLVQRGKAAFAEGRFAAAANDLLLAQGMDPRNEELKALAAEAKRKAGATRAADLLRKGMEAEALGKPQAALDAFREALEADPASARAAASGTRVAVALGDLAAARSLADVAVKSAPRSGLAFEALGIVLEAEGKKKEAREAFTRAVELDPQLTYSADRAKKLSGLLGFFR